MFDRVDPDMDKAITVKDNKTFASLSLDTKYTHAFHVTETKERMINVQITLVYEEKEEVLGTELLSLEKLNKV